MSDLNNLFKNQNDMELQVLLDSIKYIGGDELVLLMALQLGITYQKAQKIVNLLTKIRFIHKQPRKTSKVVLYPGDEQTVFTRVCKNLIDELNTI